MMNYEFKVNELAKEFGVHRNTIRNWIKSGTLAAEKGPGKRYLLKWSDYKKLCQKFGRTPQINPEAELGVSPLKEDALPKAATQAPVIIGKSHTTLYNDPSWADTCYTCGTCSGACPISGIDGLDPRKIVRMAVLGLETELIHSNWPWKCTMCGKCEENCPMNIEIVKLMRRLRSRRNRSEVPLPIHKGVEACLEKGNNLGIHKSDFLLLLREVGDELAEESCPGFRTPIDKRGARILVTVNSKDPFAEPNNLKWWWKIFYAAQESWTISSENWEAANWGFFSGDDAAMKTITGRIVDNMERLGCQALLMPE